MAPIAMSHITSLATLTARGITVMHGRLTVLEDVDLVAAPGHAVGVLGPNGVGKSTLLRVLAGLLRPDKGTVALAPPSATRGYLAQEPERRAGELVVDLIARRTGVAAASSELDDATVAMAAGDTGSDDRYSDALDRWLALGGADQATRAEITFAELGLDLRLLQQEASTLSGGEAARVQLATLMLSRFDILLLDEPTNDLDLPSLARLEHYVNGLANAIVLVSHDRAFLERTVTNVVELDEHERTASHFAGGWVAYQQEHALARRRAERDHHEYVDQRDALKARAQREREWATQGVASAKRKQPDNDKVQRKAKQETTEQLAARASRSERAIERLEVVDKPWEGWELQFGIAMAPRAGAVIARLDEAVVHRGEFTLGPVTLEIGWAERVAIVGDNGSGKTTLLGALLQRLPLDAGRSYLGPGVVLGEIDQARRRLDATEGSLLDGFMALTKMTIPDARTLLAKFGLSANHVGRGVDSVSPGERTRAAMALLQAIGVNCLVLDEPTNHLDLPAIEQLEGALDRFAGTVLLVTHDRQLLATVRRTRTIHLVNGQIASDDPA